jgi:hypothetical protein
MKKEYECICGYVCSSSQKFNAHRGHCKPYLQSVGKYEKRLAAKARAAETGRLAHLQYLANQRQKTLDVWLSEKHVCENCGKIMTEKYGSGRFCSRSCANSRKHTEETKAKIRDSSFNSSNVVSKTSKSSIVKIETYLQSPKFCTVCGNILSYERRNCKTCGGACLSKAYSSAGKIAASKLNKRSKNEIAFCTLCENYFGIEKVLRNEPMFNGWDADIIIPEYKLAILWNGPWHYKTIVKGHSLQQVQTRDAIKIDEIKKYGFIPYIIKDLSKENKEKVFNEFDNLLKFIQAL